MSELIRRVLSVGAAPAHEEVDDPVTPTVLRYRVLLAAIALYLLWRRHTAPAISLARPWGPRWLAALTGLAFSELLRVVGRIPVATLKPPSKGVDDSKQHVVVWHPHGALTTMAFMHCGYHSVMKQPLTWFPGIAPVLFNVPFLRETTLLLNARAVSGKVMEKLASAGLNVGVQPGGIPEQLQSDHRREIAVFPPNLGFVRLAMRHGAALLPAYIFGENQAYTTYDVGRRATQKLFRMLGVVVPIMTGRWGLPWLVPNKVDIHVCWGNAVSVGPANATPTDAQVEEVFGRYCAELLRVFDKNKDACLPPEVAARGLTIVRRETPSSASKAAAVGGAKL